MNTITCETRSPRRIHCLARRRKLQKARHKYVKTLEACKQYTGVPALQTWGKIGKLYGKKSPAMKCGSLLTLACFTASRPNIFPSLEQAFWRRAAFAPTIRSVSPFRRTESRGTTCHSSRGSSASAAETVRASVPSTSHTA